MFEKLEIAKRPKIKLLEINTIIYEMTNTLDGINGRLHIGELEDTTIETSKHRNRQKQLMNLKLQQQKLSKMKQKTISQMKRASVSYGTTSGDLLYV